MHTVSIGIMAYNEERNIGRLLETLLSEKTTNGVIGEIVVVASGCTDRTEEIVRNYVAKDEKVKLLVQRTREGKASAINLFLMSAKGDIIILESGDTLPETGTLDKLLLPFGNPHVGMVGGRPVPVNRQDTFVGFTVNLMWFLHHKIALKQPKLGEMVAFRNFVRKIPSNSAVDEASIEAIVRGAGYELCYVPDAVVHNKGPETVREFIRQRRRIAAGHKHLLRTHKYEVSTVSASRILRLLLKNHSWCLRDTVWTLGAIGLEITGRALGYYDYYVRKKNPFIWDVAPSTKNWN